MSTGLQPTVQLFMMDEQDAVPIGTEHPCRTSDMPSEVRALPAIPVVFDEIENVGTEFQLFLKRRFVPFQHGQEVYVIYHEILSNREED